MTNPAPSNSWVVLLELGQQVPLFGVQGVVDSGLTWLSSKRVVAWPHFLKKLGLKNTVLEKPIFMLRDLRIVLPQAQNFREEM